MLASKNGREVSLKTASSASIYPQVPAWFSSSWLNLLFERLIDCLCFAILAAHKK
jgi:hypothetical protein